MNYLAVLGRQSEISIAELEALFSDVKKIGNNLAEFTGGTDVDLKRLGGIIKVAIKIEDDITSYLAKLPEGKITFGVSDYSKNASSRTAISEALKIKRFLTKNGRSVRVVENKTAEISSAAALHNGLYGENEKKLELIKLQKDWYKVVYGQDIEAYARRDQARPARDAKVGMLPPKLAQILINLCGPLKSNARILDPFCGTGVVLQEAMLMGYMAYGTDLSERMVEYTNKNLEWLNQNQSFEVTVGDATNFHWSGKIDAVACEGYLGRPMSQIPVEIKLKTEKQETKAIVIGFLKNLSSQIKSGTPVVIAVPAWLRNDGTYSRLEILDEINDMGYNVHNKTREGLLYHRDKQVVARDIIILRKK